MLLEFDGFVLREWRLVDGEIKLTIETTADRAWCRSCGVRVHSKGRTTVAMSVTRNATSSITRPNATARPVHRRSWLWKPPH